jgi:hypothetical protein
MQRLAHPLCGVASRNTLLHSGATNGTKSLRLDAYRVSPCRHGGLAALPDGVLATVNFGEFPFFL